MSLSEVIRAAYAVTPRPDAKNITHCPCEECREIASYFTDKTWEGLEIDDLRRHETALFHCTPEAFRYYLPAFMLAVVDGIERAEAIPDLIVWNLTPHADHPDGALPEERIGQFSKDERSAVAAFLRFLIEIGDCQPAEVAPALAALEAPR
jgi:hypothetical protein